MKESADDLDKRVTSLESRDKQHPQTEYPRDSNYVNSLSRPEGTDGGTPQSQTNDRPDPEWSLFNKSWPLLPNVPCNNRFSPLQTLREYTTNDESIPSGTDTYTSANTRPSTEHHRMQRGRRKKRIATVGASLVRDLGPLVHSYDTDACSYPNPGCTTQYSTDRLESLTD